MQKTNYLIKLFLFGALGTIPLKAAHKFDGGGPSQVTTANLKSMLRIPLNDADGNQKSKAAQESLENGVSEIQKSNAELEKELKALSEKEYELKTTIWWLEILAESNEDRKKRLFDKLSNEQKELVQNLERLKKSKKEYEDALKLLSSQGDIVPQAEQVKVINQLTETVKGLEKKAWDLSSELKKSEENQIKSKNTISQIEKELNEKKQDLENLSVKIEELESASSYEKKKSNDLSVKLTILEEKYDELKKENANLAQKAPKEALTKNNPTEDPKKKIESLTKEISGVNKAASEKDKKIKALEANITSLKNELSNAKEQAQSSAAAFTLQLQAMDVMKAENNELMQKGLLTIEKYNSVVKDYNKVLADKKALTEANSVLKEERLKGESEMRLIKEAVEKQFEEASRYRKAIEDQNSQLKGLTDIKDKYIETQKREKNIYLGLLESTQAENDRLSALEKWMKENPEKTYAEYLKAQGKS